MSLAAALYFLHQIFGFYSEKARWYRIQHIVDPMVRGRLSRAPTSSALVSCLLLLFLILNSGCTLRYSCPASSSDPVSSLTLSLLRCIAGWHRTHLSNAFLFYFPHQMANFLFGNMKKGSGLFRRLVRLTQLWLYEFKDLVSFRRSAMSYLGKYIKRLGK